MSRTMSVVRRRSSGKSAADSIGFPFVSADCCPKLGGVMQSVSSAMSSGVITVVFMIVSFFILLSDGFP